MNSNLKILLWNARGIRNKLYEFFDFLVREHVDIVLVSETGLNNNIKMYHPEYACYRKDREHSRGGGVAIVVRKGVSHEVLPEIGTELIENLGVNVKLHNNMNINIYSCYFPGGSAGPSGIKKAQFRSDLKKLSRIRGKYILGGDFNCRNQAWGCLRANCWGNILHDLISTNHFSIVYPPEPTLIPVSSSANPSVLDYFITNVPEKLSAALTLDRLNSDHLPVFTTFNSGYLPTENLKYDYKNTNWSSFKRFVNDNVNCLIGAPLENIDDIEHLIFEFTAVLQNAIDLSVPKKRTSNCFVKRLPGHILNLITMRNNSRRNWIRYRLPLYKLQTSFLNNAIRDSILNFRNSNWNDLLSSLDKTSPKFWNISKIIRRKTKCIPSLKLNGNLYTTNNEKSEILAQKFLLNHSISANLSDSDTVQTVSESMRILASQSSTTQNINFVDIATIKNIIRNLKNKKSPGIDGISNRFIKSLPTKGFEVLTRLFNACLTMCHFPLIWKKSKVIAIPKPGKNHSSPDSYRPISLLVSMSKVLEKIIKQRVIDFIEDNNILPVQQYGFRSEHNTTQPLVRIKKIVKENFNAGKSTAMILLDIKSAFDAVWHDALIHKLSVIGMDIPTIRIIRSYLTDRSFKVHVGGQYSQEYNIPAGCPQGSCLSPILYNIFTSDFPSLPGCESSIFADDTAILCSDSLSNDILVNLQRSVETTIHYFRKWKILVNPSKTQSIFFTRKRRPCFLPQHKISVDGVEVEWETKVRYLGVILDRKLLFNDHVSYIVNKINTTTRILYPFINRKSELNIENKLLILKVIFHAILFYAAPAWHDTSDCHLRRLQVCQNKLLKMFYNLPFYYSTSRLHSQSDILLVKDKINIMTENFFVRCANSSHEHIKNLCP